MLYPIVEFTEELVSVLRRSLKLVLGEEAVRCKRETCVGRLGGIQRCKDELGGKSVHRRLLSQVALQIQ